MYKMGCKLIACAILLSHVSSFAMINNNRYNIEDDYDDFSDTVTRSDSISIKQDLDNINGVIQNQEQNNNRQEEDKYGINTFKKCLQKLQAKESILKSYLEEMIEYIEQQSENCFMSQKDDYIKTGKKESHCISQILQRIC